MLPVEINPQLGIANALHDYLSIGQGCIASPDVNLGSMDG
jgi:hypothetical protein